MRFPRHALVAVVLLSCAAGTRHMRGGARAGAVRPEVEASGGVDELQHGASLFEQVGRDAVALRAHLSEVSDRSRLFGPDIRRLERMFDGFERVKVEGLECLRRRDRAGAWARLNALVLGLPVLTIQLAYLATASHAEDAGVVTSHWMGMLAAMRAGTEPVLDAMVGFDVRKMEAAAAKHRQELVELQEALPKFQKSMLVGARWTEKGLWAANGVMAAASVYEMAAAFEAMGGGPGSSIGVSFPALAGAGAGSGVVVISTDLLEALRELVRIGALSAPVLSTVAAMMGRADPPSGPPASAPRPGRTYPSRPPDPTPSRAGNPSLRIREIRARTDWPSSDRTSRR